MLARCGLAVLVSVVVCLYAPSLSAQENGAGAGQLQLPEDLFENGASGGADLQQPPMAEPLGAPSQWDSAGGGPVSYSGAGSTFSPSLGGHLRARYNTQSYGQVAGNLDLGTMFRHDAGDTSWFLDGQVTLNDESQVGYNLGVGFRTIASPEMMLLGEREKLVGLSLWSDGSSTINDNFFPQIGVSFELLGDNLDLRGNAYYVVEDLTATGDPQPTGGSGFFGNSLVQSSLTGIDHALHVTELEAAHRIADRELWGFAGVYGLWGEGDVDSAGYKLGFRGYATPDLGLQIAVTDDDLFKTNTVFSVVWFMGRTRTNTPLYGNIRDRMREPVIRNDYVAILQDSIAGGGALTDDLDGDGESEEIRFVHVDSAAPAGGDGSFENPLNSLDDVNSNSMTNDVVLVHAESTFSGEGAVLQDGQRFLGEGDDVTFLVQTDQFGALTIPETAPGARSAAAPVITNTTETAVTLADGNEVANFNIDGGASAIVAGGMGAGNPNLHDLDIANTTGDAIVLTPFERMEDGETTIAFNVTLDEITFDNIGGNDIDIDAATTADPADDDVTLNEMIAISNITSTDGAGVSLNVANTHAGGTLNVTEYDYDGGATGLGGMAFTETGGLVNVSTSDIEGGVGTGLAITDTTGLVSIGSSVNIEEVAGDAASISGNEQTVTFDATVSNETADGGTVRIVENAASVNVNGDITANNADALDITDAGANVTVSSNITRNGTTGTAVSIFDSVDGDGAEITFSDINATITNNGGGRAVAIDGGDDMITFISSAMDDGGEGVLIENRTGGTVDFTGAVSLENIAPAAATNGAVQIAGGSDDSIVNFTDLQIDVAGGVGLLASGGELNIDDVNETNSITADAGRGMDLSDISSTSGITFQTVDVSGGADNGVVLDNVAGEVTVNGGTLSTINEAVDITDAANVSLDGMTFEAGGDTAVVASYTNDDNGLLSITDADADGDDFDFSSSGAGNVTATMTEITGAGAVAFDNSGDGNASLTLADVESDAGFDYDVSGQGNLNVSMNEVTGAGATTIDVAGDGNGTLNMTDVNTGSTITASSSAGAGGNLTLDVEDSGQTTAFGAVTVNDQGDGNVTATLDNVDGAAGVDFDAAGDGSATLTIAGGSYGGGVDADAVNNGNFTATINSGADITGAVDINAQNDGTFTSNIQGQSQFDSTVTITADNMGIANVTANGNNTFENTFTLNTSNQGDANVILDNDFNGAVTVNAANRDDFALTMANADVAIGTGGVGFTLDITSDVNNADIVMTGNEYDSGVVITANNSAQLDVQSEDETITTGSNDVAYSLLVDAQVDDADVAVERAEFTTNNASAYTLTAETTTSAPIRFLMNDNVMSSANDNVVADILATDASQLDATVTDNSFTNQVNGSDQFRLTGDGGGVGVLTLLSGNSANNTSGNYDLVQANGATYDVTGDNLPDVEADNDGTVNTTGTINFTTDTPQQPSF